VTFDGCADRYEEELAAGLSVTGEGMAYYAPERLDWVRRYVERDGVDVKRVLDFGGGVGHATPYIFDRLGAAEVTGVDVSARSLERAREQYGSARAHFVAPDQESVRSRVHERRVSSHTAGTESRRCRDHRSAVNISSGAGAPTEGFEGRSWPARSEGRQPPA
jgi:SAM-dependent methyltransferase